MIGTTSYTYSPLDLLTQTLDVNGNLTSQTDAKNQTLGFAYDALDRLTNISGSSIVNRSFPYDQPGHGAGIGRRTAMFTAQTSTGWAYDARGRVTQAVDDVGGYTGAGPHQARSVGGQPYSYHSNGNLTSRSERGQPDWTRTPPAAGRAAACSARCRAILAQFHGQREVNASHGPAQLTSAQPARHAARAARPRALHGPGANPGRPL